MSEGILATLREYLKEQGDSLAEEVNNHGKNIPKCLPRVSECYSLHAYLLMYP